MLSELSQSIAQRFNPPELSKFSTTQSISGPKNGDDTAVLIVKISVQLDIP